MQPSFCIDDKAFLSIIKEKGGVMKKLALLATFIIFVIGCGGAGDNYFPLTVGYEWDYQWIIDTTIADTTYADTGAVVTWSITAEDTLNDGTPVFELTMGTIPFYIEETEDYIIQYTDKAGSNPDTVLAIPLEDGKTWNVDDNTTAEVVNKESVTVTAGTYDDCWKVMFIRTGVTSVDTYYNYYAPDVGHIKNYERTYVNADTTVEWVFDLVEAFLE